MHTPLALDANRLLPVDPAVRAVARDLYDAVADMPILSPHGHVEPSLLLRDEPFPDPAELLVTRDHYVTRLLHAAGVPLDELGVGGSPADPRTIWRRFAENWHLFAGTASGYWLTDELVTLFGIDGEPSAASADALFDAISAHLAEPAYRPRALFARFGIEVLATTDDPLDDLAAHAALAQDPTFSGRVIPTFRPDAYLDPEAADFVSRVERLTSTNGSAADDFAGYLDALEARRAHFIAHGAVSADHGVQDPYTVDLPDDEAAALYRDAVNGRIDAAGSRAFRGNMLLRMAGMSARDGLVMTIHPGVLRNHSAHTHARFGPDTGHDIPVATEFTENLRPLLNRYGLAPGLHIVLFTVDESTFSRELAPLAGFRVTRDRRPRCASRTSASGHSTAHTRPGTRHWRVTPGNGASGRSPDAAVGQPSNCRRKTGSIRSSNGQPTGTGSASWRRSWRPSMAPAPTFSGRRSRRRTRRS